MTTVYDTQERAADAVTGARAEVTVTVDLPPERFWELAADVARTGEWSPECTSARWLDASGPRAGARFAATNRYADGSDSSVLCVVTEAVRPTAFAWVVLDASGDPERPMSAWRYELAPGDRPDRTVVRQTFTHGPGASGARDAALREPAALAGRLGTLRENMAATLAAMARSEEDHR